MKNNCKNRKLRFIRNKNRLRLGITKFYCVAKITPEMNIDAEYFEYISNIAQKSLFKEYNLKLPIITIERFEHENDFINNLITIRITLSKFN